MQFLLFADSSGGTRRERLQDVIAVRSAGGAAGDLEVQLRPGRGAPVPVRVGDGFDVARLQQLFAALQRRTGSVGATSGASPKELTVTSETEAVGGRGRSETGVPVAGAENDGGGLHDGYHPQASEATAAPMKGAWPPEDMRPSPAPAAAEPVQRAPVQRDAAWRRRQEEMQARLKAALEGRLRPAAYGRKLWAQKFTKSFNSHSY
jgi:hypothetical protein